MELTNSQLTTVAIQLILITISPRKWKYMYLISPHTYICVKYLSISGLTTKEVTKGIKSA